MIPFHFATDHIGSAKSVKTWLILLFSLINSNKNGLKIQNSNFKKGLYLDFKIWLKAL